MCRSVCAPPAGPGSSASTWATPVTRTRRDVWTEPPASPPARWPRPSSSPASALWASQVRANADTLDRLQTLLWGPGFIGGRGAQDARLLVNTPSLFLDVKSPVFNDVWKNWNVFLRRNIRCGYNGETCLRSLLRITCGSYLWGVIKI